MRTDLPLSAGTFFTERVKSSLKGMDCSRRCSISSRSSAAISSRSLRAMLELGKVVERAEDDDEERHDGDEGGVVPRERALDEDEGGHQQGDGHAGGGDPDGELVVVEAHSPGDGGKVAGNDH